MRRFLKRGDFTYIDDIVENIVCITSVLPEDNPDCDEYIELNIATLLALHNRITAVEVISEKVEKINNKISLIQDEYIEIYLAEKAVDLTATLDGTGAYGVTQISWSSPPHQL